MLHQLYREYQLIVDRLILIENGWSLVFFSFGYWYWFMSTNFSTEQTPWLSRDVNKDILFFWLADGANYDYETNYPC